MQHGGSGGAFSEGAPRLVIFALGQEVEMRCWSLLTAMVHGIATYTAGYSLSNKMPDQLGETLLTKYFPVVLNVTVQSAGARQL